MAVVLSIDIGTTSVGLVAFDSDVRKPIFTSVVANSSTVTDTAPGLHEQDAVETLKIVRLLLKRSLNAVQGAHGDARSIRGIAITGQMHGIVLVGPDNRPMSNLYTWRDRRSTHSPVIREVHGNDAVASRCGCRLQPGYGLATLHQLWIDDRYFRAELRAGTVRVCGITDLVAAMLCGRLVTDTSMAASWGGLDIHTHRWDEEVLDALQIPEKVLPSVLPPSQPYGSISPDFAGSQALGVGTAVCSGIGDHQASVLSCRPIRAGTCILNIGTGSQISIVQRGLELAQELETRPLVHDYSVLTGTGLCGGWSYEYLARFFQSVIKAFAGTQIALADIYETMNAMGGTQALDANGLTVDPRFLGSRTDHPANGTIYGIDASNLQPSILIRATANGIVDELFGYYSRAGAYAGHLFITGNAARQVPMLHEAVRHRWGKHPVAIQCDQEAALGAAYLAAANLDLIDQSWLLEERVQDMPDIAGATALIDGRSIAASTNR